MATSLVALHVASNAEGLSTTDVSASKRFLTRVAMRMNTQARWT